MKKIVGFIILLISLAMCQDSNQSSVDKSSSLRDVGKAITLEEAQRWRTRYESQLTGARQQNSATISKQTLQMVVNALAEYDGLYFHHALQGEKHHVLVIPYKDGLTLWSAPVVVDANSDSMVDVTSSSAWAELYVAQNPDGPWSHFFGRDLFESILSNDEFEEMEIAQAINDSGAPQLLLYALYSNAVGNGRAKGQSNVYDHSSPCPTYCPE